MKINEKNKVCPNCKGEGYSFFINQGEPDLDSKCTTCKGTGKIADVPQPPAPPPPRLIKEGGETIWKSISDWLKKRK